MMRTTINLDDDIIPAVKSLADAHSMSMGAAVSALVRQSLRGTPTSYEQAGDDLPVFKVSEDAPLITLDDIKRDEDEA